MPRQSDVAIWLHAMRLASAGSALRLASADKIEMWDKAFDAQQTHAQEQDYSCSNCVVLGLLDAAAWRFMGMGE